MTAPRLCSVEGCDKRVSARGFCALHYQRWARNGDPTVSKRRMVSFCSIEGCGKPARGHSFCGTHYKRWSKYGDANTIIRKRNICSVDGCGDFAYGHGWCSNHYQRWKRHSSPTAGRVTPGHPAAYIEKALAIPTNECLVWPFARNRGGYGVLSNPSGSEIVSRIVCEMVNGPAPEPSDEYDAAHSCDNPPCFNPRHLRWATREENMQEAAAKGRTRWRY